jgi:hypothetical protein
MKRTKIISERNIRARTMVKLQRMMCRNLNKYFMLER